MRQTQNLFILEEPYNKHPKITNDWIGSLRLFIILHQNAPKGNIKTLPSGAFFYRKCTV